MNLDSVGVVVTNCILARKIQTPKKKEKSEHEVLKAKARTIRLFTQQSESLC
jgi:hypothetical protein